MRRRRSLNEEPDISEEPISEDLIHGLSLPEQLLLLGVSDRSGTLGSLWNDTFSYVLRASVLINLGFSGRLRLENSATGILGRNQLVVVPVTDDTNADKNAWDPIGDEVWESIYRTLPSRYTLSTWLDYISGISAKYTSLCMICLPFLG